MNPWVQGGILSLALAVGVGAGWLAGRTLRRRSPNAWVSTLILLAGSLGGPLVTYRLLGPGIVSYIAALLIAGLATGFVFWPMGEKQGEREWL
ncbi:MAG: hypothetical protein ACK47B_12970 [Armatimonadota bacterium]